MRIISKVDEAEDLDLLVREIINVSVAKPLFKMERGRPRVSEDTRSNVSQLEWYPSFDVDGVKFHSRAAKGYIFINLRDIDVVEKAVQKVMEMAFEDGQVRALLARPLCLNNGYCTVDIAEIPPGYQHPIQFVAGHPAFGSYLPAVDTEKVPVMTWHVMPIDKFDFDFGPSKAKKLFGQNVHSVFYDSFNVIDNPTTLMLTEQLTKSMFWSQKNLVDCEIKMKFGMSPAMLELRGDTEGLTALTTTVWETSYDELVESFGDAAKTKKCKHCKKEMFNDNYFIYEPGVTAALYCPFCIHGALEVKPGEIIIRVKTPWSTVEAIENMKRTPRQKKNILIDMELNGVVSGGRSHKGKLLYVDVGAKYRGVIDMKTYMTSEYGGKTDRKLFTLIV